MPITATKSATTLKALSIPIKLAPIFSGLFNNLSEREKEILMMRFGLDDVNKHTLEAIGQKFGITRERVRQIENAAIKKLATTIEVTDLPKIINYATALLEANGGILEKFHLLRELVQAIKSKIESDMHYLELALIMSANIYTVHNTIKFHPHFHLQSIDKTITPTITQAIIAVLKKEKEVVSFSKLKNMIAVGTTPKLSIPTISNICKISKELKVTPEGAVGLFKWSHINPRNIHDKVVFTLKGHAKPLHFGEITKKIKEHNFDAKTVNIQAVHNELIRHEDFILIGRGIYALKEWGYTPGTVSDVITEILQRQGAMERDAIIDKVLEVRQVKIITIQLNLKNKKLFSRVGRNTYELA